MASFLFQSHGKRLEFSCETCDDVNGVSRRSVCRSEIDCMYIREDEAGDGDLTTMSVVTAARPVSCGRSGQTLRLTNSARRREGRGWNALDSLIV